MMGVDKPGMKPFVGPGTAIATRYFFNQIATPGTGTAAVTAGRLYMQPFRNPGLVINRLAVNTTVGAVGSVRMGLYANNADGMPGDLIQDAGTTDHNAAEIDEVALAADFTLPEWIWVGMIFEGTPTVTTGALGAGGYTVGQPSFAGTGRGYIGTQAYGALPATPPTLAFTTVVPCMAVRKA